MEADLSKALAGAKVKCELMKSWGRDDSGKPWIRYTMSCSVPRRLQQLLEKRDPSKVVRQLSDPEDRFTAVTAFAAMGRFHQLPAAERMRYVLELAKRNDEPFASTRIGFVFGRQPWWDRNSVPEIYALGTLAAPWDKSMTAVIRTYLFPKIKHRSISTLAVYLCKLMAGTALHRSIIPDLKRIARMKPRSFEAEMALEAVKKMGLGR